jgi:uncharacterized protein with PQ loop repeat
MSLPLHHFIHNHIKEEEREIQEALHSKKWIKRFDRAMIFVGMISPIMTIPQVLAIWINKDAGRVSALSWGAYLIIAFFWLIYGIAHKSKPLIITEIAWIIVESVIVIGVFIY